MGIASQICYVYYLWFVEEFPQERTNKCSRSDTPRRDLLSQIGWCEREAADPGGPRLGTRAEFRLLHPKNSFKRDGATWYIWKWGRDEGSPQYNLKVWGTGRCYRLWYLLRRCWCMIHCILKPMHETRFNLPVLFEVLKNAQGVYPNVLKAEIKNEI